MDGLLYCLSGCLGSDVVQLLPLEIRRDVFVGIVEVVAVIINDVGDVLDAVLAGPLANVENERAVRALCQPLALVLKVGVCEMVQQVAQHRSWVPVPPRYLPVENGVFVAGNVDDLVAPLSLKAAIGEPTLGGGIGAVDDGERISGQQVIVPV